MTPPLSKRTSDLVDKLFLPDDQAEAKRLLIEECGENLPFCNGQDEVQMERIRFGAIRLGIGFLDEFRKAISVAKSDWRDLLVAARFAESLTAHDRWAEATLKENQHPLILLLVGLSGSGKTTIGAHLTRELGWMFFEGDAFHSTPNFNRFMTGQDIPEKDVAEWLEKLRNIVDRYAFKKQNLILACTALKESQRQFLHVSTEVCTVYLHGTSQQLEERQKQCKLQLSNLERLAYQSTRFEEPQDALVVDIGNTPEEIVASIRAAFSISE